MLFGIVISNLHSTSKNEMSGKETCWFYKQGCCCIVRSKLFCTNQGRDVIIVCYTNKPMHTQKPELAFTHVFYLKSSHLDQEPNISATTWWQFTQTPTSTFLYLNKYLDQYSFQSINLKHVANSKPFEAYISRCLGISPDASLSVLNTVNHHQMEDPLALSYSSLFQPYFPLLPFTQRVFQQRLMDRLHFTHSLYFSPKLGTSPLMPISTRTHHIF